MLNLVKIGNDGATQNSVNEGFTEHKIPCSSGGNYTSDLTSSEKEEHKVRFHMLA